MRKSARRCVLAVVVIVAAMGPLASTGARATPLLKLKLAPSCTMKGTLKWIYSVDTHQFTVRLVGQSVNEDLCTYSFQGIVLQKLAALVLDGTANKLGACEGGAKFGPVALNGLDGTAYDRYGPSPLNPDQASAPAARSRNSLPFTFTMTVQSFGPGGVPLTVQWGVDVFTWQLAEGCPASQSTPVTMNLHHF